MLSAERIALLKHGAPPRNALEAALRNAWGGGGASYEKTVGPAPIISISDAKAKPAKSLIVGMEPIQDLHGYDSPWPAGGGTNLIDVESATVSSQSVLASVSLTAGTYTLSAYCTNNTSISGYLSVRLSGVAKGTITISSGDSNVRKNATFTLTDSGTYDLVGSGASSGYNFAVAKVQLESGSSMTTYFPYENLCPISGRTEANIYRYEYDADAQTTYTIQLGQTVYGGTVDVVTGVLTVDRYYFKGGWTQYNSSHGFRAYRSGVVPYAKYNADVNNKPMSNTVGKFGSFSSTAMTENIIQPPRSNSNVAYMALDENVSPDDVDLCYLVAEPQTFQLTPQKIQMLKGANVLWSDADALTLTYIGTEPANLLGGMLGWGLGNPQEPADGTSEEPTERDGE